MPGGVPLDALARTPRPAPQLDSIPYGVKAIGFAPLIAAVLIWVVPSLFFDVPKANVDQGTTLKGTVTRILEQSTEQGADGPELLALEPLGESLLEPLSESFDRIHTATPHERRSPGRNDRGS